MGNEKVIRTGIARYRPVAVVVAPGRRRKDRPPEYPRRPSRTG